MNLAEAIEAFLASHGLETEDVEWIATESMLHADSETVSVVDAWRVFGWPRFEPTASRVPAADARRDLIIAITRNGGEYVAGWRSGSLVLLKQPNPPAYNLAETDLRRR